MRAQKRSARIHSKNFQTATVDLREKYQKMPLNNNISDSVAVSNNTEYFLS